ncbi:MAG: hypothetical protein SF053_04285, partial [Bacteroidia bacterium]|nr:hypothetical protein [Bacteroidia bacterium]
MFRHIIYICFGLQALGLTGLTGSYAQQPAPGSYTLREVHLADQTPPIFFEHLTWREGLPPGGVSYVFTDRQGYLWLMRGQARLSRYDGHQLTHFVPDPADSSALPDDIFLYPPVYDAAGRLWFPCVSGMVGYDPLRGTFRTVRLGQPDAPNLALICTADRQGRLWVLGNDKSAFYRRLYRFDPEAGVFERYDLAARQAQPAYGPEPAFTLHNSSLDHMQADRQGRLWYIYWDGVRTGLMRFEPEADRWTFFPYPNLAKDPAYAEQAPNWLRLVPDPGGERVWLTSWVNGLHCFDLKTLSWAHYATGHTFVDVLKKSRDELWLTGYDEGLFVLNTQTSTLQQYLHQPAKALHESPLAGRLLALSQDNPDSILWITSEKGLSKIDPHLQNFTRPSPLPPEGSCLVLSPDEAEQSVFALYEAENGRVILYKWQEQKGMIRRRIYSDKPASWEQDLPYFIQRDYQGRYWAGLSVELDPQTLVLSPMPYPLSRQRTQQQSRAWRGLNMPNGDIWFPNRWGGLFHFDAAQGHIQGIDPLRVPDSTALTTIRTVLPASAGRLWLATLDGLILYDPRTQAYTVYTDIPQDTSSLPGRVVMDMLFDPAGRLWLCTTQGLCWLDTARKEVHRIPETRYTFSRMVMDRQGTIWAIADESLVRYEPASGKLRLYTEQDGLRIGQFERMALSPGGSVMLGNKHIWDPAGFVDNTRRPEVVFTDFKVFDKPYPLPR